MGEGLWESTLVCYKCVTFMHPRHMLQVGTTHTLQPGLHRRHNRFCCDVKMLIKLASRGAGTKAIHADKAIFMAHPAIPALVPCPPRTPRAGHRPRLHCGNGRVVRQTISMHGMETTAVDMPLSSKDFLRLLGQMQFCA